MSTGNREARAETLTRSELRQSDCDTVVRLRAKSMAVAYTGAFTEPSGGKERLGHEMSLGPEMQRWFALQVRTRWESSTALLLSGKGYQTLLPTYRTNKRWNGRLKEGNAPLFPGYVFCQFEAQKRLPILVTPGVIAVVGGGKVPLPVDDAEIDAIQALVSSGVSAEPWPFLEVGQKVRIESEALQGLEGILVQFKGNHRIVLSVSLLRRSVALEIDRSSVTPIGPPRTAVIGPISSHRLVPEAIT